MAIETDLTLNKTQIPSHEIVMALIRHSSPNIYNMANSIKISAQFCKNLELSSQKIRSFTVKIYFYV